MKLLPACPKLHRRGMTITELMVATAVFLLAIAGIVTIHLAGQRMNLVARAKLGASDEARDAISRMVNEIRGAGVVRIGNGSSHAFTEVAFGQRQEGNAIEVYPTKGVTNQYIRYFWDLSDQRLKRSVNGAGAVLVVAHSVSNQMVFTSEDFTGNVLSNNFNNRVIGLTLQFFQLETPGVPIGPGCLYDFYQLRTRVTRRALE